MRDGIVATGGLYCSPRSQPRWGGFRAIDGAVVLAHVSDLLDAGAPTLEPAEVLTIACEAMVSHLSPLNVVLFKRLAGQSRALVWSAPGVSTASRMVAREQAWSGAAQLVEGQVVSSGGDAGTVVSVSVGDAQLGLSAMLYVRVAPQARRARPGVSRENPATDAAAAGRRRRGVRGTVGRAASMESTSSRDFAGATGRSRHPAGWTPGRGSRHPGGVSNRREVWRDFMGRFEPSGDPRDAVERGFYVPRPGRTLAEQLAARFELKPAASHLLMGGVGSGKTTQLLVARDRLEATGDVNAVYVDVSLTVEPNAVRVGDLVVAVGLALAKQLEHTTGDAAEALGWLKRRGDLRAVYSHWTCLLGKSR